MSLLRRLLSTPGAYGWRGWLSDSWAAQAARARFDAEHAAYKEDDDVSRLAIMQVIIFENGEALDTPENRSLMMQLNLLHRARDLSAHAPNQEWWVGTILTANSIEVLMMRYITVQTLIAMAYNELLPDGETERLTRILAFEPHRIMRRMFELAPESTNWLVFGMQHCPNDAGEIMDLMRKQQEAVLQAYATFVRTANAGTGTDVGDSHRDAELMMSSTIVQVCGLNPVYRRLARFQPDPRFLYETAMRMRLYMLAVELGKDLTPEDVHKATTLAQRASMRSWS